MKKTIQNWSDMSCWGNYKRQYINAILRKDDLFEIRVGVICNHTGALTDYFTWSGIRGNPSFDYYTTARVYKTGDISLKGFYSLIGLQCDDFFFDLEFACEQEDFIYKISPVSFGGGYDFNITFFLGSRTENLIHVICRDGKSYENNIRASAKESIYATNLSVSDHKTLDAFIAAVRTRHEEEQIRGDGLLGNDVARSMIRALGWNKVYDTVNHAFQIDVTRLWAKDSCYYSFYWDNLLVSLPAALEDKASAYDQVESICSEFKNGFLPQCSFEWGSSGMMNPPIGSYCLLKLYRQFGEIELLEKYFTYFYDTNRKLSCIKGDRKYGLICLLGDEQEDPNNDVLATGLDNSPMYDQKDNLIDVGMSSIFALDCLCLSLIADILGRTERSAEMKLAYDSAKHSMNQYLWNEEKGIYCNRMSDGAYQDIVTPTSFYPMLAGIPDIRKRKRLINEHLLKEDEFWGEYVIPSVSKNTPAFYEQNYWRGCAWAPMNFLVYEGLRNCGEYEAASELAEKGVAMYEKNWREHGYVLENYSTITGSITENCVPMYSWGSLLAYIGVEELIRFTARGIEFGSITGKKSSIKNILLYDKKADILFDNGLSIFLNSEPFIRSEGNVIVFMENLNSRSLEIMATNQGCISVWDNRFKLNEGLNIISF